MRLWKQHSCVWAVAGISAALASIEVAQAAVNCNAGNIPVFNNTTNQVTCTAGAPPSLSSSASEVSTAEVLNAVRERRSQGQGGGQGGGAMFAGLKDRDDHIQVGPRTLFGLWTNSFAGHEQHKNLAPTEPVNPNRTSKSGGLIAGADMTIRSAGDIPSGVQIGILGGASTATHRLSNIPASTTAQPVRGQHHLAGGMIGAYAAAFYGGFTADVTVKADFLNLDPGFVTASDAGNAGPAKPSNPLVSGTSLTTQTVAGNLSYRMPIGQGLFFEPTAGLVVTHTAYDSRAEAYLLADGTVWRIQGGARIGAITPLGAKTLTTTLTGLLYSDVSINGFTLTNFNGTTLNNVNANFSPADEGKLMGRATAKFNLDHGGGITSFVEGSVYGGQDVKGISGLVGSRIVW
jgi:hypothetical protein